MVSEGELMQEIKIRLASVSDADAMLAVYAPYVGETVVSFEYTAPTEDEFRARIKEKTEFYPCLVAETENGIVAYAYASRERSREAYDWNAELSIYIQMDFTGRGLGTALYTALLDILLLQGIVNVYGVVATPNENSERLHKRLGFSLAGVHYSTGYKLGTWCDVTWFVKQLVPPTVPPPALHPITELRAEDIEEILYRSNEKLKCIDIL
jgi:L-amino acid N-acyltransferase YncA